MMQVEIVHVPKAIAQDRAHHHAEQLVDAPVHVTQEEDVVNAPNVTPVLNSVEYELTVLNSVEKHLIGWV